MSAPPIVPSTPTSSTQPSSTRDALRSKVASLSTSASKALDDFERSNVALYKALVDVLLLWIECRNELGFLDDLYAGQRYKKPKDNAETLFPFLKIIFAKSSITHADKSRLSKWNIALLCLLYELENNAKRYRAKMADKLIQFIQASGGIDGLLSEEEKQRIEYEESILLAGRETPFNPYHEGTAFDLMRAALQTISTATPIATLNPARPLRVDEYQLVALLAQRSANGTYTVLGSTNRAATLGPLAHDVIRRPTQQLPAELKAIVDVIRTQAYPPEAMPLDLKAREEWLTKVYRDETRFSAKKVPGRPEAHRGGRLLATKKLLITGGTKEILLSASSLKASVVTKFSNATTSLEAGELFCLPGYGQLLLERMCETGEINAVDVVAGETLQRITSAAAPLHYSLHLKRPTRQRVKIIELYDPARYAAHPFAFQADFDFGKWSPSWAFNAAPTWFAELRERFLDRWFTTLGARKQVKRLNNQAFEITVTSQAFKMGFNLSDAGSPPPFELPISHTSLPQNKQQSAFYLSKDLGPVFYNIGDLDIVGEIAVSGNSDALVLSFTADIGTVAIAIPAAQLIRAQYERIDKAFAERRYV